MAVVESVLERHLTDCSAANKKFGERLWQVCVIVLGGIMSAIVWLSTQGQQLQMTAKAERDAQTQSIIQAIGQIHR
jgi:hypothetical protein